MEGAISVPMSAFAKHFQRPHGRRVAVFKSLFVEDAGEVDFHSVFSAAEDGGDVVVGFALGDPEKNFGLARGETEGFEWLGGVEVGFEFDFGHRRLFLPGVALKSRVDGGEDFLGADGLGEVGITGGIPTRSVGKEPSRNRRPRRGAPRRPVRPALERLANVGPPSSSTRKAGRPATRVDIRELVLRMATENRSWGYTRIQGALANLRHEVGRGTIAKILREGGLDPAPNRRKGMTWKEFLRTHWSTMAATDFFTVEVWTRRGLV